MESRLNFVLANVVKPLEAVYIKRFRHRFCAGELEGIVPDIVRYIVTMIHPTNQVLASAIVQRWEMIYVLFHGVKVHVPYTVQNSSRVRQVSIVLRLDKL
jgi:Integrator complex subunit 3 N-terminal